MKAKQIDPTAYSFIGLGLAIMFLGASIVYRSYRKMQHTDPFCQPIADCDDLPSTPGVVSSKDCPQGMWPISREACLMDVQVCGKPGC